MPESLGKTLKKIRESKNLSIKEVSERTRMPQKILSIIEGDRLHEISSPFYARTFVRSYSQFLEAMDEGTVKGFLTAGPLKDPPVLAIKGEKASACEWFIKHKRFIGSGLVVVFGLWVLFFGFVNIGRFMRNVSRKHKTELARRQKTKQPNLSKKLVLPKKKRPKIIPVAAGIKKTEGIELEIIASYNTWIQVVSDGKLFFSGVLKKKHSDIWRAKEEIRLELGNAGGVDLKLNGRDLGRPGKKGEKKTIIVTKEGIKP